MRATVTPDAIVTGWDGGGRSVGVPEQVLNSLPL